MVLSLKIIFHACQAELRDLSVCSPSGHTASATVVYGGLLALFGRPGVGHRARHLLLIALAALLLALLFG